MMIRVKCKAAVCSCRLRLFKIVGPAFEYCNSTDRFAHRTAHAIISNRRTSMRDETLANAFNHVCSGLDIDKDRLAL